MKWESTKLDFERAALELVAEADELVAVFEPEAEVDGALVLVPATVAKVEVPPAAPVVELPPAEAPPADAEPEPESEPPKSGAATAVEGSARAPVPQGTALPSVWVWCSGGVVSPLSEATVNRVVH